MVEIEESETFFVSPEEVEQVLSPRTIVESAGTYDIAEKERTGDRWHIVGSSEDIDIKLEFARLENGYAYEQVDDVGPFEEMRTSITYEETEQGHTDVTITSRFTFGLPLATVTDRLAGWSRQVELRRILRGLAKELAE